MGNSKTILYLGGCWIKDEDHGEDLLLLRIGLQFQVDTKYQVIWGLRGAVA